MAVWGTPVAREDDAERAVRAGLELVEVVGALGWRGRRAGAWRCASGIVTGDAAVTVGAEGQGMVAGDLVNTAARVQSAGRAGHRARRRADAASERGRGRLRRRGRAHAEGEVGAGAALAGRARDRRPRAARAARPGSRRRSSDARPSSGWSRTSSTPRATSAGRGSSRSSASPGSARRGSRRSSSATSTVSSTTSSGTAAAAWPTATASRTGRWPRWCGCAPGSASRRTPADAAAKLRETLEEQLLRRRGARLGRGTAGTAARSRRAGRLRP